MLALPADLAFEINCQVAAAGGDTPQTPAAAFALAPADGPARHVQVQLNLDTEPERVVGVVSAAVAACLEYVRQVSRWTAAQRALTCPRRISEQGSGLR